MVLWNLAAINLLLLFIVALTLTTPSPTAHSSSDLRPRARIDTPNRTSCSRNERRTIVQVLREAAQWTRLMIEAVEDVPTEQPHTMNEALWRRVRRQIFEAHFGGFTPELRSEFGVIFQSLQWELDRSPGGTRQNDDGGGNVVSRSAQLF